MNKLLLYYGDTLIGDINKFAKSRRLTETLKSESDTASADTFTFDINWRLFQRFIARSFDEAPEKLLKVGKTRMVFETNDYVRFGGYLAAKPARSGVDADQTLSLTFYEHFARLAGDLVCSSSDPINPYRRFENVGADEFVKTLIGDFLRHASAAGEELHWDFGVVDTLGNKTVEYKDFPTVSKALCDAMNNVEGVGKFDVVFRINPADYTKVLIDILKPRGTNKNIIIKYPSDGVYKLWASEYSIDETNEYASEVLIAGNGQVGNVSAGEQTAKMGTAKNADFAKEYCYYRVYETSSNLVSQGAVDEFAKTRLAQLNFAQETPKITLVGRPIRWGDADNEDDGLALGDTFYFEENTNDGSDNSGFFRIIGLETSWDDNGVETVNPTLKRTEDV